jgi:ADP-ribose pyrophosphatase YjhB (NUDIX family)
MDAVHRRAARLVVMDPDHNVLLFQYEDDRRRWWATPGGGLEADETFEEAAGREAAEELSITCTALVPLWRLTAEFTFRKQPVRQIEHYFLLLVSRADAAPSVAIKAAHRLEGIVAARWWSLREIGTTSEQVFPSDLCERLRDLQLLISS